MPGTEEKMPSEIEAGGAEEKYKEMTEEQRDSKISELKKLASDIEGQQQHPLLHLKELKIEGGEAEEKHDEEAEEESSKLEEEEEEEEEGADDEEEEEEFKPVPRPDWFYDEDYLGEGETEVDWEKWKKYREEIAATQGFGLTVDVGLCEMAGYRPVLNFKARYKFFFRLCELAIKKYNQDNIGKDFKMVDVEWVVNASSRGVIYLLTFNAEDVGEGVKTFEAKVLDGIMN